MARAYPNPPPPRVSRRIWCETAPWEVLRARETIAMVARLDLRPIVAVRPWDVARVGDLVRAFADAGVAAGVWPMLADRDGRWTSAANAARACDFARRVLDACAAPAPAPAAAVAPALELAVDLEPPIDHVRALLDGKPRAAGKWLARGISGRRGRADG